MTPVTTTKKPTTSQSSLNRDVMGLQPVLVIWMDAYADLSAEVAMDEDVKSFGGVVECHDVGFLVRRSRKETVLAVSRTPSDNTIRHAITIPTPWIKKVVSLNPAEVSSVNNDK